MSDGTMNTEVPISADGLVYHINARGADIADNILLVGDPGRVAFVAGFFDAGSVRFKTANREIATMTGTYKGVPVTAMSTGMGTDNVEIVLTEIHILKEYDYKTGRWTGPKKVNLIRCGTCGSPQADVTVGSLAVTHLGIGMDNTGRYYHDRLLRQSANGDLLKNKDVQELARSVNSQPLGQMPPYFTTAHPDVTGTLQRLGRGRSRPVVVGHTASASGFYACQGRKVGRLSDIRFPDLPAMLTKVRAAGRPVVNIEMECSALCHISHILGYRAGCVCVVLAARCVLLSCIRCSSFAFSKEKRTHTHTHTT